MSRAGVRLRALAFGVALPLFILVLAELGVRWFGEAPPPALLRTETESGIWWTREPNLATLQAERPTRADRIAAAEPRDPETCRIVVLGESTAAGFPLYPYLSFGRVLEQLLVDLSGERTFEVVNLGKAADSSDHVREVAASLGPLQPDVVLVYAGHNDYQVPYCEALREGGLTRLLGQLRLVQVLAQRGDRAPRSTAPRPPEGRLVGDDQFLTTAELERGAARFEDNLRAVVAAIRAIGAECVLMTQAANLRSFAPSYSVFRDPMVPGSLDAEARASYEDILRGVRDALAAGQSVEEGPLVELVAQDPGVALTWFLAAQGYERRGLLPQAREAYRRALALDRYPNRAPPAFNDVIRRVADERNTALVDVEAAMQEWASGAVPGADLFFDHCHPDVDATFRLGALAFGPVAEVLVERRLLEGAPEAVGVMDEPVAVDAALTRMGLDRAFLATRSLGAARLNLLAYLESPTSEGPLGLAENAFGIALQVDPEQPEALAGMTVIAILRGDAERALNLAKRATAQQPDALVAIEALASATPTLATALTSTGLAMESGRLVQRSR